MTIDEAKAGAIDGRKIIVGVRTDGHGQELLDWALVKVADPGDHVVAVHVCRDSDSSSKEKALMDGYLEAYEGLCTQKKVDLTAEVLIGSSIRKVLVREAKNRAAVAVIVGTNREIPFRTRASVAKYCAKHLPPTTNVLAIHNGKVVYTSLWSNHLSGKKGDPRPSLSRNKNPTSTDNQSEYGDSETSEVANARYSHELIQSSKDGSGDVSSDSRSGNLSAALRQTKLSSSLSFPVEDFGEQRPGWPLLRTGTLATPPTKEARKISVVRWVMSLPDRSPPETPQSGASSFASVETDVLLSRESINSMDKNDTSSAHGELLDKLDKILKTNSSSCKWFSFDVIKTSTTQFSSDKLIGQGGCNCVYKGLLPDGRPAAVKVLRSCKQARQDFTQEVEIMRLLEHKNINHLLGISIEDSNLISVYDFCYNGSLEQNLHGNDKQTFVLPWEVRFKVAVGIAEALHYLHEECSPPVIHRDVKSSNILLSDEFEPQLSDFGLAIWGPSGKSFLIDNDVVGTFGYLAPEYFMYGKVSDKIDVYSFGVVLLELLTGRKPICSETAKGWESLVMWAKPKLETGEVKGILDPNLDGNIDDVQAQRMLLAARLCLTRSARLRPKMSQILKILREEKDLEEWENSQFIGGEKDVENTDDEVYPHSSAASHLGLALLDVDDTTSSSSMEQSARISMEEYLKRRWSRSSSLD